MSRSLNIAHNTLPQVFARMGLLPQLPEQAFDDLHLQRLEDNNAALADDRGGIEMTDGEIVQHPHPLSAMARRIRRAPSVTGNAAAGAFLRVKGREPQIEIVVVRTDLMVGNPQLAEPPAAEGLEPIVPGQREFLGMVRHIGRDRLSRLKIRTVAWGRLDVARKPLPRERDPAEDLFP